MKVNFKKIGVLFLMIFSSHCVGNKIICPLVKKEKCEKDIPHIFEGVRIDQREFMPPLVANVSGTFSIVMSDVDSGHWE